VGHCECTDELFGPVKCREFLDQLKFYPVFKKDSAAWS